MLFDGRVRFGYTLDEMVPYLPTSGPGVESGESGKRRQYQADYTYSHTDRTSLLMEDEGVPPAAAMPGNRAATGQLHSWHGGDGGGPLGRPTAYNPRRTEAICEALKNGNTRTASAQCNGISTVTFYDWLKRYPAFSNEVTRAEAEAERLNAEVLRKAADGVPYERTTRTVNTVFKTRKTKHSDGTVIEEPVECQEVSESTASGVEYDWRAAESWLKRRRRDEWGDAIKQEHSGPDGGPIDFRESIQRKLSQIDDAGAEGEVLQVTESR